MFGGKSSNVIDHVNLAGVDLSKACTNFWLQCSCNSFGQMQPVGHYQFSETSSRMDGLFDAIVFNITEHITVNEPKYLLLAAFAWTTRNVYWRGCGIGSKFISHFQIKNAGKTIVEKSIFAIRNFEVTAENLSLQQQSVHKFDLNPTVVIWFLRFNHHTIHDPIKPSHLSNMNDVLLKHSLVCFSPLCCKLWHFVFASIQ